MPEENKPVNFIHNLIDEDYAKGVYTKKVHTRFPPEPNGYLHIGSAKAIFISYLTAVKYGGSFNLRFDDTNPQREDDEYVESIMEDIRWLGVKWDKLCFASDYFGQTFELACRLIKNGDAYVCDLTPEQVHEYRGTLTEPGKNSPYRNRSAEENLDLFMRMKNGEFPEGSRVLRAKIDMASPNMNMRDPVIYRICYTPHHRQGTKWCVYPMYDYAHPLQDAIEGITHSLCSIEFEDHRPLYNWSLEKSGFTDQPPRQIEFSRLEITDTVMSKRYLRALVENKDVDGWDDPRMPTLCGLRRRGVTPFALRDFIEKVGVSKAKSTIDREFLDYCIREDLKMKKPRMMAVIDPVKVIITNYDKDKSETFTLPSNPENAELGTHETEFSGELYIEREDFMPVPPPKYHRLYPGNEVRLMGAYIVKCTGFTTDGNGNVTEVLCTYDPDTKNGTPGSERKVKGTIHWVSQKSAVPAQFNLYGPLYKTTEENGESTAKLNPDSLSVKYGYAEGGLAKCAPGDTFQFVRNGYFCRDTKSTDKLVFNRTAELKSSFKLPTK